MGFFRRIFGGKQDRARLAPLYDAIVAKARQPHWYLQGGVPDTVDGRFDMIASLLALVLLRLEKEEAPEPATLLAELFADDMNANLRQIGIGDFVVGKHVLTLMGALGGRLAAYRGDIAGATVRRNVFRDSPPSDEAVDYVAIGLRAFADALAVTPIASLLAGELPRQ